jgi:rubrerythrin
MDTRKIYEYALQREYEGKRFFEQNAERLNHAAAVNAFKKLAAEEQKHIEFIQGQLDLLGRGRDSSAEFGVALQQEGFFSQRALSESIEQTVSEAMVADLPVLRMAYLIERDLAEFYEMAAAQAPADASEVLNLLATWERGHERLFKRMHDEAFQEYAEMPWGG